MGENERGESYPGSQNRSTSDIGGLDSMPDMQRNSSREIDIMATKEKIIEDINTLYGDMSFELDEALESMQEIADAVRANIDALDEDIGRRDMGE